MSRSTNTVSQLLRFWDVVLVTLLCIYLVGAFNKTVIPLAFGLLQSSLRYAPCWPWLSTISGLIDASVGTEYSSTIVIIQGVKIFL